MLSLFSSPSPPQHTVAVLPDEAPKDNSAIERRLSLLEAKSVEQEVALASVTNECRCLRAHAELLEARLESSMAGFQAKVSKAIVDITTAAPSHAPKHVEAHVKEKDEAYDIYNTLDFIHTEKTGFGTSIWDATFFIGYSEVGCLGSVYLFLLFLLNGFIQGVFLWVVERLGSDITDDETLDQLLRWRFDVAHSLSQVGARETSLVARVCSGMSLNVASGQAGLIGLIDQYIPRDSDLDGWSRSIGPILCVLALLIWFLVCMKEFDRVESLGQAILHAPAGSQTILHISDHEDGLELVCMTCCRKLVIMLVLLVRLSMSGVLLVFGLIYLSNTFQLESIILNAVALEIVLNVDEIIFEGLVPIHLKNFLCSVQPIKVNRSCQVSGLNFYAPLRFILVGLLLILAFAWQIAPNVEVLDDARDVVCSGHLDFVYAEPLAPPFFAWSHTLPGGSRVTSAGSRLKDYNPKTWREKAIRDIILSKDPEGLDISAQFIPILEYTKGSLSELSRQGSQEASAGLNALCEDAGSADVRTWEMDNIMDRIGNRSIGPVCAANGPWHEACNQDTLFGQIARLYCASLCQCGQPHKSQVIPDKGCAIDCDDMAAPYRRYRNCSDMTNFQLNNRFPEDYYNVNDCTNQPCRLNSHWTELVNNFESATQLYTPSLRQRAVTIMGRLRNSGCSAVAQIRQEGTNLCSEVSLFPGYQAFTFYCPIACQCAQHQAGYCPTGPNRCTTDR